MTATSLDPVKVSAPDAGVMYRGRCTHGLRAGTCTECPVHDRLPDGRWVFLAAPTGRGGRTFLIGGYRFKVNRHGCHFRETSCDQGWRCVTFDWDDETSRAVRDSLDASGIGATCSPSGLCSCAPRF